MTAYQSESDLTAQQSGSGALGLAQMPLFKRWFFVSVLTKVMLWQDFEEEKKASRKPKTYGSKAKVSPLSIATQTLLV